MINKEDINRSLKIFENLDLKANEINLIFTKFKKILKDKDFQSLIKNEECLEEIQEDDDLGKTLNKLLPHLNMEDLNHFLNKIIEDESLTNYIQDLFLEKLL